MHSLSLDDADTLPDLDEKFHGNQSGINSSLNELNSFTAEKYVTGEHEGTGEHIVTGDLNVSGGEYLNASPINGGQVNGKHSFEIANSQLQKARKRLLLSLKKKNIRGDKAGWPGNSGSENKKEEGIMEIDSDDSIEYIPPDDEPGKAGWPGNSGSENKKEEGIMEIDSDDSIEYIPPDDEPGNEHARWVFIPVGQNSR